MERSQLFNKASFVHLFFDVREHKLKQQAGCYDQSDVKDAGGVDKQRN